MAKKASYVEVTFKVNGASYKDVFIIFIDVEIDYIPHVNTEDIEQQATDLCRIRYIGAGIVEIESCKTWFLK